MPRPAVVAFVPAVAVLAAILTGCVGFPVPDDVATYRPDGPGGAAAALSGTLVRDDGCTYIEDPESGVRTIPVFEAGHVSWAGDRLILDNLSYAIGDTVEFGGGEYAAGSQPDVDVPEACDDSVGRWQVN